MTLLEKLMQASNGGLDIILHYYPDAVLNKNFKVRAESTASAAMRLKDDGNYIVTDFGEDSKPRNAVAISAKEDGVSFKDALITWSERYNILEQKKLLRADTKTPRIDQVNYEFEYDNTWHLELKPEISEDDLKVLGPFVTEEICKEYNLFSVAFYAKKKLDGIVEMHSTEHFPIFAFINKSKNKDGFYDWIKIYQPKAQDKAFRFFYINGRPKDFVFGLERAEKIFDKMNPVQIDPDDDSTAVEKIKRIVICSGDRDSINMASLGETVIWMNSETEGIPMRLFRKLKEIATTIINVPDLDTTGRKMGIQYAQEHIEMKTAWIPSEITQRKDFRGKSKKDFTDYCNMYGYNFQTLKHKVYRLLENALQVQFWSVKYSKEGGTSYNTSLRNLFYFLELSGFYKVEDPEDDQGFKFVKVSDHLVEVVTAQRIKEFIFNYLELKREELGDGVISVGLLNLFYAPNRISEAVLSSISTLDFKETKASSTMDFFHFRNQVWKITPDAIENLDTKEITSHVWEKDIVDSKVKTLYSKDLDLRKIKIDSPYFEIKNNGGDLDIKILNKNCEFLNYSINISRVYWKDEIKYLNKVQRAEHLENNLFSIDAPNLSEEQIFEQKGHLINKIYAFGYLLHRYKESDKAWAVVMMDNEVVSLDESHGGTGKSIFTQAPGIFISSRFIGSRNPKLFENDFLFDGVTKYTDYILFDDANSSFDFNQLYSRITSDFNVNPKGRQPYVIPFREAPKMAISTNFTLKDSASSSTSRRLLEVAASNWYHHSAEGGEGRIPRDDFKHKLFDGWNDEQWNMFFNFSAQCLKFYLSTEEKISAPNSQVKLRQQLTVMGVTFQEWADIELKNLINPEIDKVSGKYIDKQFLIESAKSSHKHLNGITAAAFFKKLKAWCIYNNVVLNPVEIANKDGRIIIKENGLTKEKYYLYCTDEEILNTLSASTQQEELPY